MKDISDRSIRNINVRRKHEHTAPEPTPRKIRRTKRPRRLWLIALGVVVAAAILGLLLSAVFAGASVTVTPRSAQVSLPATIQAALNAPPGTLPYQSVSVTLNATTTVPAKGSQQVSRKASGVLTISNTYSSAPQKLIANTRFESPDGKIYRIQDAVVVPGMSGTQPGTTMVSAYADQPGAAYNRTDQSTSYVIPGFKGDPRYAKITATSGPVEGGFVGTQPGVAQSDLTAAKTAMERQLDGVVRQTLTSNIPAGYKLIDGTLVVNFGTLAQTDAGGGTAALSEPATASAYIIGMDDLAAAVAKQTVQNYGGEAVTFAEPQAVSVSASSSPQSSSLLLQLGAGDTTLVWIFDLASLKDSLIGKDKSQFETIIKGFQPAIAKANASIRPFWTSTFPSDPGKISVKIAGQ